VQFAETDLAGMVHFSNFFRYMEEAEHGLWRAAGLRIDSTESVYKWPRVAAAFDFKRPLRFEDEFEVHVGLAAVTTRTIQYNHTIIRGDLTIGVGTVTAACVQLGADHVLRAVEIPAEIIERLRAVVANTD
jgi:acyl-CoA thioester hydrolase